MSETWIPSDAPDPVLHGCVPPGYRILHIHRGDQTAIGGGLAIIYRDDLTVKQTALSTKYNTFECQLVTVTNVKPPLSIANIYRPPTSTISEEFSEEFGSFLNSFLISCKQLLICGDFNCPWAPGERINPVISNLERKFGLKQYIDVATHVRGNILDLLFDQGLPDFFSDIKVSPVSFSDHFLVEAKLNTCRTRNIFKQTKSRNLKRFNAEVFVSRLQESDIFMHPANSVDEFVEQIERDVTQFLDDLVPFKTITKRLPKKPHCWLSDAAIVAKRIRRRLERRWLHTRKESDRQAYRNSCRKANKLITESLQEKHAKDVEEASENSRTLWRAVNKLSGFTNFL